MNTNLNDRQTKFCFEYLKCDNATQAAIKAGYSKKTAYSIGQRLLKHVEIKAYIESKKQKVVAKLEITYERTMLEIGRLAFQDVRKFYRPDGSLIPIHELDDDAAAVISGIEMEEIYLGQKKGKGKKSAGRLIKIKRFGKDKAVEILAKHFKLYSDGANINNNITQPMTDEQVDKVLAEIRKKKA